MSKNEMIKWLQNLKKDIGQSQHQDLWHYAEVLDEVIGAIEVNEDAISREYMLEVQKKLKGYMPNDKNYELWDKIKNAPSVVPKPREGEWIPCSERLPHAEYGESDNVLVTCESKCIRLLYFNGGNWCYPTGEYYGHRIDKVVAWMPLPEPWKGVSDEH